MLRLIVFSLCVFLNDLACPRRRLRVMSFNIRTAQPTTAKPLGQRKEFVVDTGPCFNPIARDAGDARLSGDYWPRTSADTSHRRRRDHGDETRRNDSCTVPQRAFREVAVGHFWLSETPDVPAARAGTLADAMVTWLKLKDRKATPPSEIYFFNTHFDHRGQLARQESARLIRRKVANSRAQPHGRHGGLQREKGPAVSGLFTEDGPVKLHDSFRRSSTAGSQRRDIQLIPID